LRYFWSGTGEHGVGIGKREFLVEELGAGTVALMKAIKRTIDPLGLFNPGKVGTLVLCSPATSHYCGSYTPMTIARIRGIIHNAIVRLNVWGFALG
jgi:hypothetical protein